MTQGHRSHEYRGRPPLLPKRGPELGVFDKEGRVLAYTHAPEAGDVIHFYTPLGHTDHLEDGIMYLLISDTITACIRYLPRSVRGLAFVKRPTGFTLIARTGSG